MQKSETTPQPQLRKGSATMKLCFGHERRRRGAGGRDNATLGTRGREQRQLRKGSAMMKLCFGHEWRRRGAGSRDNATLGTRGREQRQLRKGSAKPTSLPQHPSSDIFNNQNSDDRSEPNHH